MSPAVRASIAWAAWLVACAPVIEPPEGVFACASAGECPDGWSCVAGRCYERGAPSDGGVDAAPRDAGADAGPVDGGVPTVTIYDVADGTAGVGARVRVEGVVTAVGDVGLFIQLPTEHPDYRGVNHSGAYVFTGGPPTFEDATPVARGTMLFATGEVIDFFGWTEIGDATLERSPRGGSVPASVVVTPGEVNTGGTRADELTNVLVEVRDVTVTDPSPAATGGEPEPIDEYLVAGLLYITDFLHLTEPYPTLGTVFSRLTGVLVYRFARHKLAPRDAGDVVR